MSSARRSGSLRTALTIGAPPYACSIFLSPPQSIGANIVGEMFFLHEKGAKLGVWTLLVSLGPPVAPLIMGPLVYHTSWRWIFWLLAIINLAQFVLYIFLAPETAGFVRPERNIDGHETVVAKATDFSEEHTTPWWHLYFKFRRVSGDPWSKLPIETIRPLAMAIKLPVILPTLAYSVVFAYSSVRYFLSYLPLQRPRHSSSGD